MQNPPENRYFLFTGHIGCGKSTELTNIGNYLDEDNRYCVIRLDCLKDLDVNNLRYSDVLLGLAYRLLEKMQKVGVNVDKTHLQQLEDWFNERVITHEKIKRYEVDLTAGMKASLGLPFFATLFGSFTSARAVRIQRLFLEKPPCDTAVVKLS